MLTLHDVKIDNRRVVLRVDFNVPISAGEVVSDERLKATIPTIEYCLAQNAEIVLLSHLGRPKGKVVPEMSLRPVARRLAALLDRRVEFIAPLANYFHSTRDRQGIAPGKVSLLENLRFEPGEETNDEGLGNKLGTIGDVYVFEAFATAHRTHASTSVAIKTAPVSCIGLLVQREVETLSAVMAKPNRPWVAVLGGSKISGKLEVLKHLGTRADAILVGGGIANTCLLAQGNPVGRSLVEKELVDTAKSILTSACLELPVDVMVCVEPTKTQHATHRLLSQVGANDMIVDIGPETGRRFAKKIADAGTVLWNGPLGMFELDQFGEGTRVITQAVGRSSAFSVVGGGDTIAAMSKYGGSLSVDYISTGGGAFLKFVEGHELPALAQLKQKLF